MEVACKFHTYVGLSKYLKLNTVTLPAGGSQLAMETIASHSRVTRFEGFW